MPETDPDQTRYCLLHDQHWNDPTHPAAVNCQRWVTHREPASPPLPEAARLGRHAANPYG